MPRSYFIAANPSTERHLYSVPLPTAATLSAVKAQTKPDPPTELTDAAGHGYHSVSFSPFGGYYVLSYSQSDAPV
jgi:dipeptidyl aminopeptidase